MLQLHFQTLSGVIGRRNHNAFSVIELMIVIAIIGLVAAFGMTAYREHVVRSTIASLVPITGSVKASVESAHNEGTVFGTSGNEVIIATTDTDKPFGLDSMTRTSYGCIELDLDMDDLKLDNLNVLVLVWCPSTNSGSIEWQCGYGATSTAAYITYLPNECQVTQASIQDSSL